MPIVIIEISIKHRFFNNRPHLCCCRLPSSLPAASTMGAAPAASPSRHRSLLHPPWAPPPLHPRHVIAPCCIHHGRRPRCIPVTSSLPAASTMGVAPLHPPSRHTAACIRR